DSAARHGTRPAKAEVAGPQCPRGHQLVERRHGIARQTAGPHLWGGSIVVPDVGRHGLHTENGLRNSQGGRGWEEGHEPRRGSAENDQATADSHQSVLYTLAARKRRGRSARGRSFSAPRVLSKPARTGPHRQVSRE